MTTVYEPPPPMMQPVYGTSPNYGYVVPTSGPPYQFKPPAYFAPQFEQQQQQQQQQQLIYNGAPAKYGLQSQPNQQSSPLPPMSSNGNEMMAPNGSVPDSAAPAQTLNNGGPPFPVAGPPVKY